LGGSQVVLTAAVIGVASYLVGLPWQTSILIGLALALSSTAIVLQIMGERGIMQIDTGKSGVSVLLFQDVAVVPILAIVPLLAVAGLPVAEGASNAEALSAEAAEPGWMLAL